MNKELVVKNIRYLLKKKDVKNNEIWKKIGMSESRFSEIKNGKWGKQVPDEYLKLIAEELNVSYQDLISEDLENIEKKINSSNLKITETLERIILLITEQIDNEKSLNKTEKEDYWKDFDVLSKADDKYNALKAISSKCFDRYDSSNNAIYIVMVMSYYLLFVIISTSSSLILSKLENVQNFEQIDEEFNKNYIEYYFNLSERKNVSEKYKKANDKIALSGVYCLRELSKNNKYRDYSDLYVTIFAIYEFLSENDDDLNKNKLLSVLNERLSVMQLHQNKYLQDILNIYGIEFEKLEYKRELE